MKLRYFAWVRERVGKRDLTVRVEGNYAGDGGGAIWMQDMEFELFNSTLTRNSSDGLGGGVRIDQGPHGSTVRIVNTTFHANVANNSLGA